MEKKILPFIISLATGGAVHQLWQGRVPFGLARPTSEQGRRDRAPAGRHGRPPLGPLHGRAPPGVARATSVKGGKVDLCPGQPRSGGSAGDIRQAAATAIERKRRRR
jgi:hypothetical protein